MRGCRAVATAILSAAILMTAKAISARGETYPNRPIKLVTQGAAGSGPDVIGRIVTDHLGRLWGQQIVIINQPGAGGSAAARMAAAAAPDGYTLYMAATSTFLVMPEIFPSLPIDLDRDFVRIGLMGEQPMILRLRPRLALRRCPNSSRCRRTAGRTSVRGERAWHVSAPDGRAAAQGNRRRSDVRSLSGRHCRPAGPHGRTDINDRGEHWCAIGSHAGRLGQGARRCVEQASSELPGLAGRGRDDPRT